jgi:N,N'-diacetyllegionaminate synthase
MLERLELGLEAHQALVARCAERGLIFLSTPFDEESADLLEGLGVPAFKVPSGELTNLPFLRHLARKGRPLVVSTGMATLDEVQAALSAVRAEGARDVVLLQCVSNYPADAADTNLRAMATMAARLGVPVGYSDHTLGIEVSLAAVALGACVLEKHFTLDRSLPGPDHRASAEPEELGRLVAGVRRVEAALGDGVKRPAACEADTARVARRSLVAACAIPAGTVLEPLMVTALRPGGGIAADRGPEVFGRRSRAAIAEGTVLQMGMFE